MKKTRVVASILVTVLLMLALPTAVVASLPVNPELTNGDFETGDLSGWKTGGTQNYSVTCVEVAGNHIAALEVGDGPTGEASCTNAAYNNFAYLDQLFTLSKNHRVELDFLVPLPGTADPTENALCPGFDPGFDRVELGFLVVEPEPYQRKAAGFITIDFIGGSTYGYLYVIDFVLGTVSSTSFDPMAFTPVTLGPLALEESAALPGWLHASMDVNTFAFPWLADEFTFRVGARLEDNRYTGQDFSLSVDNVAVTTPVIDVSVDIKPMSCPNLLNVRDKGILPVAILGTEEFDAMMVDPATIRLLVKGSEVSPIRWAYEDVATPNEGPDLCTMFGTDGYLDLSLKFDIQAVVALNLSGYEDGARVVLQITGNLKEEFNGSRIMGQDVIVIINKLNSPIAAPVTDHDGGLQGVPHRSFWSPLS